MVVEVLILVGVVVLCVGVCSGLSMLMQVLEVLRDIEFNQSQILKGVCGENLRGQSRSVADNIERIAGLADAAKGGHIPNLRYDDWYATDDDLKRWEDAERRAAYGIR